MFDTIVAVKPPTTVNRVSFGALVVARVAGAAPTGLAGGGWSTAAAIAQPIAVAATPHVSKRYAGFMWLMMPANSPYASPLEQNSSDRVAR